MSPEGPHQRDEGRIAEEDRRFRRFVVDNLVRGSAVSLWDLTLRAYAQLPDFGDYPGSPPAEAIRGEPMIAMLPPSIFWPSRRGAGDAMLARADDMEVQAELLRQEKLLRRLPPMGLGRLVGPAERSRSTEAGDEARAQSLSRILRQRIREHLRQLEEDRRRVAEELRLDEPEESPGAAGRGEAGSEAAAAEAASPENVPSDQELLRRWDASLRRRGLSEGLLPLPRCRGGHPRLPARRGAVPAAPACGRAHPAV